MRQAYVPDDFGNDSQFPVLLEAMGLQGVSFSRIPGGPQQGPPATREDGGPTLHQQLVKDGVDFIWTAADKSSTIAHYMQSHYCQGQDVGQGSIGQIRSYIKTNQPSAPTPYSLVPCGCDFKLPIPNLVDAANQWNRTRGTRIRPTTCTSPSRRSITTISCSRPTSIPTSSTTTVHTGRCSR